MTNKEAFNEFAKGATLTIAMTGGIGLLIASFSTVEPRPAEKYEVVDHYGTCAVVKYNPPQRAESVYFLDCREVR